MKPHVTDIISAVLPGTWQADEWYLQRGTAVHEGVRLALSGQIDWESVDSRIIGRIKSAVNYVVAAHLMIVSMEYRVEHSYYVGRLDLVAEDPIGDRILIDWKSSYDVRAKLQLAAYAEAYENETKIKIRRGIVVVLNDNEKVSIHAVEGHEWRLARVAWENVLNVYNYMLREGLTDVKKRTD